MATKANSASKGKLLFVYFMAFIFVLAGCIFFVYMTFGNKNSGETPVLAASRVEPPSFVNIEPFVVNLADKGEDRYLQVSLVFEVHGDDTVKALHQIEPMIRSRTLLVLSKKDSKTLKTPEGKENLKNEILDLVQVSLADTGYSNLKSRVSDTHFSTFVIQ